MPIKDMMLIGAAHDYWYPAYISYDDIHDIVFSNVQHNLKVAREEMS